MSNYTSYNYPYHSSSVNYKKNDVVNGADSNRERYYYCLKDNVSGISPIGGWNNSGVAFERSNNKVKITLQSTMATYPTQGTLVNIQNAGILNYTGTLTNGTSTTIEYPNVGPDESGLLSASISGPTHQWWTTGFAWIPTYSSSLDGRNSVITAQFGDGYRQTQRNGINNNMINLSLNFEDRTDKEVMAILNFVEDKGATDWVKVNIGGAISNPNGKYLLSDVKVSPKSYNVNNISLTATQVFNI
jgi:phage-related protein